MLSVDRLRLLRDVAGRGTISATARAVGLTASAVSQQLSALEREAGVALLERTGRSVRLTAVGRELVAHTRRVLAELEAAEAVLAAARSEPGGELRLATVASAAVPVVAPAVAAVEERRPGLHVTVATREPAESLAALLVGDVDVAVVDVYDVVHEPLPEGVMAVELLAEPLLLVLPPGRVRRTGPVALEELKADPWVIAPEAAACGRAVRQACRRAGFEPRVRWETDDLVLFHHYAAAGLGVALLPRLAVLDAAGVDVRRVRGQSMERRLLASTRVGSAGHPAVAAVVEALRAAAAVVAGGGIRGTPGKVRATTARRDAAGDFRAVGGSSAPRAGGTRAVGR